MKYSMEIMRRMLIKAPIILAVLLFSVLTFGIASPAKAFTNQEIADAISWAISAGWSNDEIAAAASSYDVSAADIITAAEDLGYGDISSVVEEAYAEVITVSVNDTNYYTTVGESANVYTAPTADTSAFVGTFNTSTGQFTDTSGATANITDIVGDVAITFNNQSWEYIAGTPTLITTPTFTTPLTANTTSLPAGGGQVTLTWATVNTTSCTASGAWSGAKATSGSQTVSLTSTATYDLTCQ